jgi:hypothetical protein
LRKKVFILEGLGHGFGCYFLFFKIFKFFIQTDQEAMHELTILIFLNMIFIISIDMQTFAFVHCIFSTVVP